MACKTGVRAGVLPDRPGWPLAVPEPAGAVALPTPSLLAPFEDALAGAGDLMRALAGRERVRLAVTGLFTSPPEASFASAAESISSTRNSACCMWAITAPCLRRMSSSCV